MMDANATPELSRAVRSACADARIRVRGLAKRYGALEVFCGIDFEVGDREIVAIVGPSGCGKTTLLRCLDGLIAADAGDIIVDQQPITTPILGVAMVFQHFGLFPWKTVYDNVAYGLRLRGAARSELARVDEYIRLVGLEGAERRYPYQLSGGMQQRAGLARALAVHPSILLMDEPFASVDAQTREILQEELLRIWERERQTMVFITHSIDEAILLGDRVAIMTTRPGRLKETLDVPFPRPRQPEAIRARPEFAALRNH